MALHVDVKVPLLSLDLCSLKALPDYLWPVSVHWVDPACNLWLEFFFSACSPHKRSHLHSNFNNLASRAGKFLESAFKLGVTCPSGTLLLQYSIESLYPTYNHVLSLPLCPFSSNYASPKMADVKGTSSNQEDEFAIKPQAVTPALDTSNWPLLLKNYDKRTMVSSDYYSHDQAGPSPLTSSSTCPNGPFHPHPERLLPVEEGHQVLHFERCHQSRQAL